MTKELRTRKNRRWRTFEAISMEVDEQLLAKKMKATYFEGSVHEGENSQPENI